METLIAENKIDKAKDVIDMAMTNMPVEHYYFYTFVEPFVDGYYKVGETDKARELYGKLKKVYQEHLEYYANIPLDEQYEKIDDILSDMQAYRRNIDILIENRDKEFAESETIIFNEYIDKFSQFVDDEEEILEEPLPMDPDMEDSIPLDTIGAINDSIGNE
jgi:tetratricopeptide (TPR) repeat protein